MRGLLLWTCILLVVMPVGSSATLDLLGPASSDEARPARAPVEEQIGGFTLRCPDRVVPQDIRLEPPNTQIIYGCPIRVVDGADYFGNIDLAVNPSDANQFAFASLHGQPEADGDTERSRSGLQHTTFTSWDGGQTWTDRPYQFTPFHFGEDAASVFDHDGNLYMGFMYSSRASLGDLLFFRSAGSDAEGPWRAYEYPWSPELPGGEQRLTRMDMVLVPPADGYDVPPLADAGDDDEPADEDDIGKVARDGNISSDRIIATWHAESHDPPNSSVGYGRWISAAWTGVGAENEWVELEVEEHIGPCMNASAPVAYRGKAYIACVVDRGYDHRPHARIGEVDIWTIDPFDNKTELVGSTALLGKNAVLAGTRDGYFVAAAYDVTGPQDIQVRFSYGWHGEQWSAPRLGGAIDIGAELHRQAGGRPIKDAHVTALAISEIEKTIYVVYSEWNEPRAATAPGGEDPAEDDVQKVMYALNECEPYLAGMRMELSAREMPSDPAATDTSMRGDHPPGSFNDVQDGLTYVRDPGTGEELVYFAINDYGIAQFGAVVAAGTGTPCPVFPAQLPPPPVPVPAAASLASMTSNIVGASFGVAAVLMAGYLLTVKRRTASILAAEDR